jgi:hypothetical protein
MQKLILGFLTVISLTSFQTLAAQTKTTQPDDHVTIQRRRIVLVRPAKLAKQFPERKTAVVTYPIVGGLKNAVVLRRVRSTFEFKNIFDYSLKEYREDTWLFEFSYEVNYNKNYLLDITFRQSGMAAYPDEHTKHFLINLKDGRVVKARDAFAAGKMNALAAMVDRHLQEEIKRLKVEHKDPDEQEIVNSAYENLKFEAKDLDEFLVGPKGVTFVYDAGFPHVIQALQPDGHYFFPYEALRAFIKRDGPLGQFVR